MGRSSCRTKVAKRIFGTVGALSQRDAKIHGKRIFVPYFDLYAINHYFHLKQVGKKNKITAFIITPSPNTYFPFSKFTNINPNLFNNYLTTLFVTMLQIKSAVKYMGKTLHSTD